MLGRVTDTRWHWMLSGKHPAAADYLRRGPGDPAAEALERWVAEGFGRSGPSPAPRSWRFWMARNANGPLVGLLRDSSDRLGRPYPLLVAGWGTLTGWPDRWPTMVGACAATWRQMEYIAAHHCDTAEQLWQQVQRLARPAWPQAPALPGPPGPEVDAAARALEERRQVVIALDGADPLAAADRWLQQLAGLKARLPASVFLGGLGGRPALAVWSQPLTLDDFVLLWSQAERKDVPWI